MFYIGDTVRIKYKGSNYGVTAVVVGSEGRQRGHRIVQKYKVKPIVREGWAERDTLWYDDRYLEIVEPKTDDTLMEWMSRKV